MTKAFDRGQIEGGYVQGVGWLTAEELWWNERGELKTHAPSTYKIPTCSDLPVDFRVKLLESGRNREETVHRSKAVGESPLMLALSAFLAIKDAVVEALGPDDRYDLVLVVMQRSQVPSVLIGKPYPALDLPPLEGLQRHGEPIPALTNPRNALGAV